MSNIVTITLNPAVDKTYVVDDLVPEHKLRCNNPLVEAGGGGINVSKGLRELGSSSVAIFFTAGRNGELLHELLQQERIECKPVPVQGETRESLVIMDQSSKKEFRIVVDGPKIDISAFQEITRMVQTIKPSWLIASGSLPDGLQKDVYSILAKTAKSISAKFILDTSGDALKAALAEGIYLIKPNLKELSHLAGVKSLQVSEVPEAAKKLISEGKAEVIVVSMSSEGAMLVTKDMHRHIASPKIEQKSTVGAGDSMVSGMVWALQNNKSVLEMVCWGIACGSAATMNNGSQLFKKEDVYTLFEAIREKTDL
ncbi:MAG: 1-phosphofructokinase family hexose kinase [Chitinophagaceae bacterium]|nr:1-phosphofructokinase family hexose kinase [Chitinophagaceae bacterium]